MRLFRRYPPGATIVVALLITAMVAVIAAGFLSQKLAHHRVANANSIQAQAKALAWVGLEEVRVKMMKRTDFPPNAGLGATFFSYSSDFFDADGTRVGSYIVELDTYSKELLVVRCAATLDGQDFPAVVLRGELDTSVTRQGVDPASNSLQSESRPFRWMRVEVVQFAAEDETP